jgi:hypothetical protein
MAPNVLEYGEVQGESQTDRVGGRKLSHGNVRSGLVRLEGLVSGSVTLVSSSELGKVTVVITHPKRKSISAVKGFL